MSLSKSIVENRRSVQIFLHTQKPKESFASLLFPLRTEAFFEEFSDSVSTSSQPSRFMEFKDFSLAEVCSRFVEWDLPTSKVKSLNLDGSKILSVCFFSDISIRRSFCFVLVHLELCENFYLNLDERR